MIRTMAIPLAVVACLLSFCETSRAQGSGGTDTVRPAVQRVGTLAEHTFVPTTFTPDPFIRTYLRTGLGFGTTPTLDTPPVVINGAEVGGLNGDLLFALMSFEYQHAIRDWLAVRGALNVIGRLADETRPLLAQGVTLYAGFDLGWLFRLTESERWSLSASLEIRNSSLTDIYLKRFIEGIVDSGGVSPGNNLVAVTPALQGGGGLRGAYAFSKLVGLTVSATVFYGESTNRSMGEGWNYKVGAAVDFNLLSNEGPPLGFVAGASTGSLLDIPGAESEATHTFFGRVGYTGSREFALGLDIAYEIVPVRDMERKQGFVSAVVDIRLYF